MFSPGVGLVNPSFWLGFVGGDPMDGPHPGGFPPQGDKKAGGYATADKDGW